MKKPTFEELAGTCPGVDDKLLRDHWERLDADYFARFPPDDVARHVAVLSGLSSRLPADVLLREDDDGWLHCTIFAFDRPGVFSLITGILAGMGFGVRSGDIFTYRRSATRAPAPRPGRLRFRRPPPPPRRRIIDYFVGRVSPEGVPPGWRGELKRRLVDVLRLVEQDGGGSLHQAKQRVNEMVTQRLASLKQAAPTVLYPVQIDIDQDAGPFTRVKVVSQDTPAFLYSVCAALSLHAISIEAVRIRTEGGRIADEFDLVDAQGRPLRDPALIDRVKLSILFTKQFTYFLEQAPDRYTALARFEQMIEDLVRLPDSAAWLDALSNPRTLQDLARLLGTSDYLWEDFIRLQYETLLPILAGRGQRLDDLYGGRSVAETIRDEMAGATTFEEKKARLNEFKDRATFRADLDHILQPAITFRQFADRLTQLAEAVVDQATAVVFEHLADRFGRPGTVAGLPARYAVMGLGKLGGAALGYGSDIELLLVYSDQGRTDGEQPTTNADFFERLAREASLFIESKKEGIFRVDLRLRPHGASGPHACSLEAFCRYYGPGGPAHSFERLALVRMRRIGGDPELGAQVERLRDEFLYESPSIVVAELRELRAKQYDEKQKPGVVNAKFSPGALVDLEYAVQILQVMYAKSTPSIRTPRIHLALEALRSADVLAAEEYGRLMAAYDFLRILINGLRMLRGNAQDLFLPPVGSTEFLHLARRMGYRRQDELEADQQLYVEFSTHTAAVRAFVERHFGRASLPGPATGNVADLVLSDAPPHDLRRRVLEERGFRMVERAYANLRALAGEGERRDLFAKLSVLAGDVLRREPDPDMALNNWERFIGSLPEPSQHFERLLSQPKRLEVLLAIFSRSQYLADLLIRSPEWWGWVTAPENLHGSPGRDALTRELKAQGRTGGEDQWLDDLRRFHHREMLRIGTRDMVLGVRPRDVLRELSDLADAVIEATLARRWRELRSGPVTGFCVLAFGKLGGRELNYSSDVDLMGVYDPDANRGAELEVLAQLMMRLNNDLARHTAEGHAYRVDLRLRPYGGAGELVTPLNSVRAYYEEKAGLWEIQALLKLRPVAGDLAVGWRLLETLEPRLLGPHDPDSVRSSIHTMRRKAVREFATGKDGFNVKSGEGGIRDIEFMVQGLQLIHAAPERIGLLTGNTLEALDQLAGWEILPANMCRQLQQDYTFLRRIEHYLQIMENRQNHSLPSLEDERQALARRVLGGDAGRREFDQALSECRRRVRGAFESQISSVAQKRPT